ncbi:MAG: monofunctional biosynthetic peptidoglycan transglycosylase [Flavobacterium sp.]|nr:MAG: monofunctional biosynthetic peptidoglycan transglycosylase [Flavobacterium sp.]
MKRLGKFLLKITLWFIALSITWVVVYKYVSVPLTPLMVIRSVDGDDLYKTNHQWKPLSEISKNLQLAVICSEDQNYLNHNGFDVKALKKAYFENLEGKRIRGGSTISQQTAKNVFLWQGRTWLRKGLEVWFTFLIETLWSKERILEVYLNSIEMGNGIFGAEAAANYWYNTSAKKLSKDQAAGIAAILPNPLKYSVNPSSRFIKSRKYWIKRQMQNFGEFTLKNK